MSMQAFTFTNGTIAEESVALPEIRPRDVLIRVTATGMNPVDTKTKQSIRGYDATGMVEKLGSEATKFQVGDRVYASGDITRSGNNAEFWAVDERIVSKAPTMLSDGEAASVPLVALTAWEGLVEELRLDPAHPETNSGKSLLVLPGAGGVGSYVIQLAKLAGLTVIATASRPESVAAVKALGADHAINHREELAPQLKDLGFDTVDYIYNAFDTKVYFPQFAGIIKPRGHIVTIVETDEKLDMTSLFTKRVTFSWELMFSRTMHNYDLDAQGQILAEVAALIEAGKVIIPQVETLPWSAESLRRMHDQQKSGTTIGKQVMAKQ